MLMEDLGEIDEYYGMRKQANPPPFLVKTYMLVEDPATDTVVSWNSDGTAFVVWQPAEFARDLLPTLFKHSNFSSFIRQLNTYGFRKVATSRWEFCNDKFQKGKRELLCHIRRRKAWAATRSVRRSPAAASPPPPSTASEVETGRPRSSSSGASSSSSEQNNINMAEENKRLKRENGMLTSELSSARSKCKELMDLVAAYTTSSSSSLVAVPKGGEEDRGVKLFGVRLDSIKGEYDEDDKQGPEKKRKTTGTGSDARYIHLPQSCNY